MMMRKRDLDVFRKVLEDRHTTLFRGAHADVREGMRLPTVADDGPGDEGDEAFRYTSRDLRMNLAENDAALAQRIEDALRRITDGSYGKCVDCGREIEMKRLRSVPWAIRCIDDQEAFEFEARDRSPSL